MTNSFPWSRAHRPGTIKARSFPGPANASEVEVQQYQCYARNTLKNIVRRTQPRRCRHRGSLAPRDSRATPDDASTLSSGWELPALVRYQDYAESRTVSYTHLR